VYEGEREGPRMIAVNVIGRAVAKVLCQVFPGDREGQRLPAKADPIFGKVISHFSGDTGTEISDEMPFAEYEVALKSVPTLKRIAEQFLKAETPPETALGMEFVLEGLHQQNLIAKTAVGSIYSYTDIWRPCCTMCRVRTEPVLAESNRCDCVIPSGMRI